MYLSPGISTHILTHIFLSISTPFTSKIRYHENWKYIIWCYPLLLCLWKRCHWNGMGSELLESLSALLLIERIFFFFQMVLLCVLRSLECSKVFLIIYIYLIAKWSKIELTEVLYFNVLHLWDWVFVFNSDSLISSHRALSSV